MMVIGIDAHKRSHTAVTVDEMGRQGFVKTVGTTTQETTPGDGLCRFDIPGDGVSNVGLRNTCLEYRVSPIYETVICRGSDRGPADRVHQGEHRRPDVRTSGNAGLTRFGS